MRRWTIAVAFALVVAPVAEAQTWRPLGPRPISGSLFTGRVAALAVSPRRANLYYAAAASGGVWRSGNGGRTWRDRSAGLPNLAIGAIAIDPVNANVVYAGSGEANYAYHSLYGAGLYRSTNAGRSWEVLAEETFRGRAFSRLLVSPANRNEIWAAVGRAGGSRTGIEGAREHPDRLGPVGIFRSRDAGANWELVRNGLPARPASDLDINPSNPSVIYASFGTVFGVGTNGIYRSTDGGARFEKLAIGFPGGRIGRISLAIAPSDPRRIYALITRRAGRRRTGGFVPGGAETLAVIRSTDGGDSWQEFPQEDFQAGAGHYMSAIAVHPTRPDFVVVGGLTLQFSFDGGRRFIDITPPHVDLHDIAYDARGRLVVADDGGVFRTDNNGVTWETRNGRLSTIQFYPGLSVHPSIPNLIVGGTQDNGTNLWVGGSEWISIAGGDGGWCGFHPTDPNILFTEFQGTGNLFRSNDGGRTFSFAGTGIVETDRTAFQAPFAFDPTDSNHMFYATQRVYESFDGGINWTPISGALTGSPWAIRSLVVAPSNPQTLYASTNDHRLLASADGGRTWSTAAERAHGWPRILRQIAVDPDDDRVAYAADMRFGGGRVLRTADRGATWTSIGASLPDTPVNVVALVEGTGRALLAGTDEGVFISRNDGMDWEPYGSLPAAPVMDLLVDSVGQRLVAATLGRGVWTTSLP